MLPELKLDSSRESDKEASFDKRLHTLVEMNTTTCESLSKYSADAQKLLQTACTKISKITYQLDILSTAMEKINSPCRLSL